MPSEEASLQCPNTAFRVPRVSLWTELGRLLSELGFKSGNPKVYLGSGGQTTHTHTVFPTPSRALAWSVPYESIPKYVLKAYGEPGMGHWDTTVNLIRFTF